MTKHEWHRHFNEVMTRLSEAQVQLDDAPPHTDRYHRLHEEVRARMHDLDNLTNMSLTPIESEVDVEVTADVAPAHGRKPLVSGSDTVPQAAGLLRGSSTRYRPDTYPTNAMNPHQDQENVRRHLFTYKGKP